MCEAGGRVEKPSMIGREEEVERLKGEEIGQTWIG